MIFRIWIRPLARKRPEKNTSMTTNTERLRSEVGHCGERHGSPLDPTHEAVVALNGAARAFCAGWSGSGRRGMEYHWFIGRCNPEIPLAVVNV